MRDGRTALASAGSGGVLLHDLDGKLVRDLSEGTGATWLGGTVATGWGGQSLVLGDHKGGIHLVDPGTGRTVRRIAGHRGGVEVATVGTLGDGRPALVTAGKDNVIRVARTLVVLAEIVTRWPALQHRLHATVDGRAIAALAAKLL